MKLLFVSTRALALSLALAAALPAALAQPASLKETVVTATRFAEDAQSLPMGVNVVTADQIQASGATTINEALMRVLGVVGRQDFFGGGEYNLDLRGFGASADNNQVVIVDGLRLSEADLGGTRLAGIPIESVERIEVLRGSGAVLYGEGATGGVIIITTKAGTGKDRRNSASAYAGTGSFGLRDLRANATVAAGGFSLDASGQKRDSDNHRDNFRSDSDAASVTGQWSNGWLRLGARVARDSLDTGLPGALTAAQYAANPRQSTTPDDHAHIRGERNSVFAEAQLGSWQLGADAGTREKHLTSINSGFPFDYDIDASNYSLRARNESSFAGVRKNLLVLGTDYGRWRRHVLGAFGSVANQGQRAWYVKDDVTLPQGTRLSVGARTERIAKQNTTASAGLAERLNAWELGASHPFGDATIYARTGRSFRLANVDEFGFTSPGVVLVPQSSRDLELGARWTHGPDRVDARVYRSSVRHEIGFDPTVAGPLSGLNGANVNFDPTRRQGLELDASHEFTSAFSIRLDAALRQATFRSGPHEGRDVPLVPHRTLALRADWKPLPAHRITGGVNWVSSQHPDFDNACTMPSYTTADVRYAYQWRKVELSLGVNNLMDRKFFAQAFGCAAGVTTSIYPEAGRAFTAAARVSF